MMARPRALTFLSLALLLVAAAAGAEDEPKTTEKDLRKLQERLEKNPGDPTNHYNLGMAYFQLERYDEAEKPLREYTGLKPDDPKGFFFLGRVLQLRGDCAGAVEPYRKGLEAGKTAGDPGKKAAASCAAQLGDCLIRTGRHDEAISAFRQALDLGAAERASIFMNIGVAQARKGDMDSARKSFEQASSLDPKNAVIHRNLGVVLREEAIRLLKEKYDVGLFPDAAGAFQKAAELDPKDTQALFLAGECWVMGGRGEQARAALKAYLEADPRGAHAREAKEYLATLGN
jgi:Flp pilus assembly protein TadD